MIVKCSTKRVAQQVRDVFSRNGVHLNLVHEEGPHLDDPIIQMMINYKLDEAQAARIHSEVSKIAGATIQ